MKIPTRWLLVANTFVLSVLLYVDRTCISTAKEAIAGPLELTDQQWSWVLAAFAFGYALFQTPGGILADRLGGRGVLTAVVAAWSLFTGLTALAWDFASLLVIRFLFGAGEAGAFPGMAKVVYAWIPQEERGLVKGINFSGSRIGAALAMPVVAYLIAQLGWQATFLWLMVIGFAWAGFWYWWFQDDPATHPRLSEEERDYILMHRQAKSANGSAEVTIGQLFRQRNLWLMMMQYFGSNFTFFFSLTWLYPFVKRTYELDAVNAGLYAMVPLLAGAVGNVLSGWLIDWLYRRGWRIGSRRLPAIVGFMLAALGMVMSIDQPTAAGAILWLSLAIFGADMTLSPSWSFCIDIGGRHAGAVSGTMNMAGNLGSAITALAFTYLPDTSKGNVAFFYTAAGLSVVAILCWVLTQAERSAEAAT